MDQLAPEDNTDGPAHTRPPGEVGYTTIHTHDPCLIERSYFRWKTLNEIDAGDLDGLSYEEIKDQYPEEYSCRHGDKFMYR